MPRPVAMRAAIQIPKLLPSLALDGGNKTVDVGGRNSPKSRFRVNQQDALAQGRRAHVYRVHATIANLEEGVARNLPALRPGQPLEIPLTHRPDLTDRNGPVKWPAGRDDFGIGDG